MGRIRTFGIVSFLVLAGFLTLVDLTSENVSAQSWRTTAADPATVTGWWPSIDLDSNDFPHISYYKKDATDLKYSRWNGTAWEIEVVDSLGDVGQWSSLVVDTNDRPHISYYSPTGADLKYAVWTGIQWDIQVVDSPGSVGIWTSMALDNNGYPHISYLDEGSADLRYAKWNGMTWDLEVVDSGGSQGWGTSLALDNNWRPHIAYFDYGNDDLKYAKWNGMAWDIETVDSADYVGEQPSLALDGLGRPHISYKYGADLRYAKWNGIAWEIETVDSYAYVTRTSIAVDSNGNPHISFNDDAAIWKRLKYMTLEGGEWKGGNITFGGGFSSIALDSGDYPHIAYYAWGSYLGYANKTPTEPSAPRDLIATGGDTQVTLEWNASATDGGFPITNHRIYRGTTSGGETYLTEIGNVLTHTDLGLTNGQTYFYQVSAVNSLGESILTDEVNATPMIIPTEPRNLMASPGYSNVLLTWDVPSSDGGSAITNYSVYRGLTQGGETLLEQLGDVLIYNDTDVSVGITYFYKVTATNAAGEGPWSQEVNGTPALPPTAPRGLLALPGDSLVNVSWVAPSYDGGSPITNYTIYRGETSGGQTYLAEVGDVRYYVDTEVTNGVTYYYKVSARNSMEEGPLSDEVNATPVNQPPTCTILSPSPRATLSSAFEISGTASDNNDPIVRVEIKIDDGNWIEASGTTEWTYNLDTTALENGQHIIYGRSYDGEDYSSDAVVEVTVHNAPPSSQEKSIFEELWFWLLLAVLIIVVISAVVLISLKRRKKEPASERTEIEEARKD